MSMKQILVPCDFSIPSQDAFRFAVRIAKQTKGEIHVLYILDITFLNGTPTLSNSYAFNIDFLDDLEKDANEKFTGMREKYCPLTLPVKFSHRIGSLVLETENYIHENNIDLVVMGTRGLTGLAWSTNTAKIIRNSPVPVVALHAYPEDAIRNIVFPLIPEKAPKELAEKVKVIQSLFDAIIHLLWINTPNAFKSQPESETALTNYAHHSGLTDFTVNIRSDYTPESGIFAFAEEIQADMIIMETHAWKGIAHLLAGSTTENLVNRIDVPVWTYALK